MAEFSILGLDPVLAKMRALQREVRGKAARAALGRAARLVAKAARANAMLLDDKATGRKIAQNVQARFGSKTYRRTGDLMYRIGVATPPGRIPKGNPDEGSKGPTPHWHLLEMGTEKMRARPFLAPALEANVDQATDTFVNELDSQLDKILSKP